MRGPRPAGRACVPPRGRPRSPRRPGWPAATRWPRPPALRSRGVAARRWPPPRSPRPSCAAGRPASSGRRRPGCSSPAPGWSRPPGRSSPTAAPPGCAPPGVRTLADLGCGLGADALAAARAGHPGVRRGGRPGDRRDRRRQRSTRRAGRPVHGGVRRRDVVDRGRVDAVFCDPARRTGRPAAGLRPDGLLAALGLRRRAARAGAAHRAEAGPRHRPRAAPAGRRGGVGQRRRRPGRGRRSGAARWPTCPRRATVLRAGDAARADRHRRGRAPRRPGPRATSTTRTARWSAPTWSPSSPHASAARWPTRASPTSGPTAPRRPPFARCFAVDEMLPFSLKRLRAALRDREVGRAGNPQTRLRPRRRVAPQAIPPLRPQRRLHPAHPNRLRPRRHHRHPHLALFHHARSVPNGGIVPITFPGTGSV